MIAEIDWTTDCIGGAYFHSFVYETAATTTSAAISSGEDMPSVPEPTSVALLGSALAPAGLRSRANLRSRSRFRSWWLSGLRKGILFSIQLAASNANVTLWEASAGAPKQLGQTKTALQNRGAVIQALPAAS
jgi:hypothetical protein